MEQPVMGIDLGTTNSVVSVGIRSVAGAVRVHTIPITQTKKTGETVTQNILPSVLYCDQLGKIHVGQFAKEMKNDMEAAGQLKNCLYNTKRHIGKHDVMEFAGRNVTAIEAASEILKKCRGAVSQRVRSYGNIDLDGVVITVPASFNSEQRAATGEAAVLAGFDKQKIVIIDEPTAALLAFVNAQMDAMPTQRTVDFQKKTRVLVFDLGGGTCDISVVEVEQQEMSVSIQQLAVGRYDELGGIDFDRWVAHELLRKFLNERRILPASLPPEAMRRMEQRLLTFAELAKETISRQIVDHLAERGIPEHQFAETDVDLRAFYFEYAIRDFYNGETVAFRIDGAEYVAATHSLYHVQKEPARFDDKPLAKNIEAPIRDVLEQYQIAAETIDYVFMTGGMSQFYPVQRRIWEMLQRPLLFPDNPMTVVADGAAVYNCYQVDVRSVEQTEIQLVNIMAEAILLDVNEGLPVKLISEGQKVPYSNGRVNRLFYTQSTSGLVMELYCGKDEWDAKLRLQSRREYSFIDPVPLNTPFEIHYEIDERKMLTMYIVLQDQFQQRIDLESVLTDVELLDV